jgi:hypothetical protein
MPQVSSVSGLAVGLCALGLEYSALRSYLENVQVKHHRMGTRFEVGELQQSLPERREPGVPVDAAGAGEDIGERAERQLAVLVGAAGVVSPRGFRIGAVAGAEAPEYPTQWKRSQNGPR